MKNKVRYLFSGKSNLLKKPLSIGSSAAPIPLSYGKKGLSLYFTCASVNGATSFEPVLINTIMTGAGQVGGRIRINMSTNVALGQWSNALKASVVYGASGRTAGLGSVICAEMTLSAGTTPGTYAPLELELNMGASGVTGAATSLIYMSVNDAASTTFDTNGYLFDIAGVAVGSGKFFQENTTITSGTHALRIRIGGVAYFIPLHATSV